jgi:hypothetical protein
MAEIVSLADGVAALVPGQQAVVDELARRVRGAAGRDRWIEMTGIRGDRDDERAALARLRGCRAGAHEQRERPERDNDSEGRLPAPHQEFRHTPPRWQSQSAIPHSPCPRARYGSNSSRNRRRPSV